MIMLGIFNFCNPFNKSKKAVVLDSNNNARTHVDIRKNMWNPACILFVKKSDIDAKKINGSAILYLFIKCLRGILDNRISIVIKRNAVDKLYISLSKDTVTTKIKIVTIFTRASILKYLDKDAC